MSIEKEMEDSINNQINAEFFSSYLYLSMAAWFENQNLTGFGNWMRCQGAEEMAHGMKFFNFLNERGGQPVLKALEAPQTEWLNIEEVFIHIAEHEAYVTSLINKMVKVARNLDDYASENFLMWYVKEQVEEEATANEIVENLKLINGDSNGIFTLNAELGTRGLTPIMVPTLLNQPGQA